jgi:AcrR family transcriptional regulator
MTRSSTVDVADLTARARIRDAALRLYAQHGTLKTSVRMVADEAGVSPGAVTHHFRTKEQLATAVQHFVLDKLRAAITGVGLTSAPRRAAEERRRAFDHFLATNPDIEGYVRHVSLEGGQAGAALFAESLDLLRHQMAQQIDAGIARELPDPEVGLVLYHALTVAHVYFRPLIENALGLDLSDPRTRTRFRAATVDLLSHPLLTDRHRQTVR